MPTFTNNRSGETVTIDMSPADIAARFAATATGDNWLWFWLARHVERATPASAAPQTTAVRDTTIFLGDMFLYAIGRGLQKPMIRVQYQETIMPTVDDLYAEYQKAEAEYREYVGKADQTENDTERRYFCQCAADVYRTMLNLTYASQKLTTPPADATQPETDMATQSALFPLAGPTADAATHIQVRLLDVKTTTGYEYTAFICPARRDGDFTVTMPFSWPTVRVKLTEVRRRTQKAQNDAVVEFNRQLSDRQSAVYKSVTEMAAPLGGLAKAGL